MLIPKGVMQRDHTKQWVSLKRFIGVEGRLPLSENRRGKKTGIEGTGFL